MTVKSMYDMFRMEKGDIPKVRVSWNGKVLVEDITHLESSSDMWEQNVIWFYVFKKILYFEIA